MRFQRKRLKPLPGRNNPCLNCPPIEPTLSLKARIAVGFGFAALLRDSKAVWVESNQDWNKCLSVRAAEARARKHPRSDWRIVLDGPLHGETYQRQGRNRWVLVKKTQGFA